ncbi:flagellar basal-body MS-ring/collar protein FliF [Pleionea sediminis]|uniref:flagellar basal-body MS-ring/collar protein FliF n=1 Tax=Pleionea sediminis TaxID=2569479 RepID=UPI0011866BA8|nr:flagellar basal-body MS-ring/collar protein FliF [Pleionea sediminis]
MSTKNVTLISLIAALILGTVFAYWYFLSDQKETLVSSLSEKQQESVIRFLDSQGVGYSSNENGEILVDPSIIPLLRMELAEKGVIQSDRVGFEIFTESDYGMTEFAQKVNFQRALQGELEKSIITIEGVTSARVHIVLPKKGTLFNKDQNAAASVLVHLEPGFALNRSSINGIQYLVSSAVDELSKEDVTVVNKEGKVLSQSDALMMDEDADSSLKGEIEELLSQWFDKDSFKVSLNVVTNIDKREKSVETVSPDGKVFVTYAKESKSGGSAKVKGDANSTTEKKYTYSKEIEKIEFARGKIERINCAIIINDSLSENQKQAIFDLVAAAIGYQEERGDTLKISTSIKDIMPEQPPKSEPVFETTSDNNTLVMETDTPPQEIRSVGMETTEALINEYQNYLVAVVAAIVIMILIILGQLIAGFRRSRNEQKATSELKKWLESAS